MTGADPSFKLDTYDGLVEVFRRTDGTNVADALFRLAEAIELQSEAISAHGEDVARGLNNIAEAIETSGLNFDIVKPRDE